VGNGSGNKFEISRETRLYGIKQIIRDDSTSVNDVAEMIADYWNLKETFK